MKILPLKDIEVGEPDANVEYFLATKEKRQPEYISAYYEDGGLTVGDMQNGSRFILYGQKGTGKTAILRRLEYLSRTEYKTRFVVFRKEIMEEAELSTLSMTDGVSTVVDEEELKKTRFYYHAMRRLLLSLLLASCADLDEPGQDIGWFKNLYKDIRNSSAGEIAAAVVDTIYGTLSAAKIDVNVLTKGVVSIDAAKAIKRSNDAFVKYAFEQFSKKKMKSRVFLDEMHFAYRDQNTLQADAALVRDTILAVQSINERLIESEIDSTIYMSIRSEFLEHEEISVGDIAHTVQSYGKEISWENHSFNKDHPMFGVILGRMQLTMGSSFSKDMLVGRFISGESIHSFLEYTWGKPRDIIRFFKAAKEAYPNNDSLNPKEFSAVLRKYSNMSWLDMRSAMMAFVPKQAIGHLEKTLQEIAQDEFDKNQTYTADKMLEKLRPSHLEMKQFGVSYSVGELFKLLYILGIFYISYDDARHQKIVHQFHRGNRRPINKGTVGMHRAVAKAFS